MTAVDVATCVREPSKELQLFIAIIITETLLSKIYAMLADEPISH